MAAKRNIAAPKAAGNQTKELEPGALATDSEEIAMRVQACRDLFNQMVCHDDIKDGSLSVGVALSSLLDRVADESRNLSRKLYDVLRAENKRGAA